MSVREKGLWAQALKALDDARLSGEIRLRVGVQIDVGCCDEMLHDAVAAAVATTRARCSRTPPRWPASWRCGRNSRCDGSWRGQAEYSTSYAGLRVENAPAAQPWLRTSRRPQPG